MTSEKKKVFGLSFLSVFLWASAFPLTKVAQQQFTSIPLGFLSCTVAAIFLIIIEMLGWVDSALLKKHIHSLWSAVWLYDDYKDYL